MSFAPQGYPLIAESRNGNQYVIVGWTSHPGERGTMLVPMGVPLVGEGEAVTLTGPWAYRLPAVANSRSRAAD